jgi:hypothetical protein
MVELDDKNACSIPKEKSRLLDQIDVLPIAYMLTALTKDVGRKPWKLLAYLR